MRANCWDLAEAAGHEGWGRLQALLRSYRGDWKDLRAALPALAAAWLPDRDGDLIGPGIAIDETAQLKKGNATVICSAFLGVYDVAEGAFELRRRHVI